MAPYLDICRVSPKVTAGPSDLWHDTTLRRRLIFLAAMWFAVGGQTYTNDLHSGSISDRFFLNQFLTSIVLLLSKWVRDNHCCMCTSIAMEFPYNRD